MQKPIFSINMTRLAFSFFSNIYFPIYIFPLNIDSLYIFIFKSLAGFFSYHKDYYSIYYIYIYIYICMSMYMCATQCVHVTFFAKLYLVWYRVMYMHHPVRIKFRKITVVDKTSLLNSTPWLALFSRTLYAFARLSVHENLYRRIIKSLRSI